MEGLKRSACLVLGGGGFIGTHLCLRLADRAGRLRVFGHQSTPPPALEGLEWFSGDIADERALSAALKGFDTVFHLVNATTPATANRDKIGDVRANVLSTLSLLEACLAQGVRRVVFASSGGTVYGPTAVIPTDEDAACWPITAYGVSKLAIERYLHLYEYLHGLQYRVLRISNPFGPYQRVAGQQGVIAAFIQRILAGRPIEVWGDGTVRRDFLYVADVAEAFERAALHEGPERIFNVGSGVSRSLNEVIAALADVTGVPIMVSRYAGRAVDVPVSALDVSRAEQSLGWRPTTSFMDGLARTVNWARAQQVQAFA
jgi:UDP-glucose 4-epimerase